MEYFILDEDERLENKLKINFSDNKFEEDTPFILNLKTEKYTQFQDYMLGKNIFNYYFCISEKLYKIFSAYDDFKIVPFFITDIENKIQMPYFKIEIRTIDCILDENVNKIEDIVICKEKINDKYIFKIKFKTIERIVVSLHLAENILKALPYGIKLVPLKLK
nr:hypothetical protein [uncultured Tyzzerella sp.]